MEDSAFGRRLLDMIQVQLNTNNDPVNTLITLMEKFRDNILKDRATMESMWQSQDSDCKKTLPELANEIKKSKQKKASAENNAEAKDQERDGINIELNENQKVLTAVNEQISNVEGQIDSERKRYEESIADIARIREALRKAKEILGNVNEKGSLSFVEVQDNFNSLKFQYDYVTGLHKMALTFLEMAKADPSLMQHLFEVIDKIVAQLGENEFQLTQAQSLKTNLFTGQVTQLSALQFDATAKVNQVQARLQDLTNAIQTISNDIKHLEKVIEQKGKEVVDKQAQCSNAQASYKQREQEM